MSLAKIRPRRGTLYEWSTVNPILKEGELGLEFPDTGIGTGLCKFKIGDGINRYNDLAYAFDGQAAASIDGGDISQSHSIQLRGGTAEEWADIDPVLDIREPGFDITNNGIKIGDGVHKWSELDFIISSMEKQSRMDFGDEDVDDIVLDETSHSSFDDLINEGN